MVLKELDMGTHNSISGWGGGLLSVSWRQRGCTRFKVGSNTNCRVHYRVGKPRRQRENNRFARKVYSGNGRGAAKTVPRGTGRNGSGGSPRCTMPPVQDSKLKL